MKSIEDARPDVRMERQVESWLSKMTLKEKVSLLSGRDSWYTVPVERLGVRSLLYTDGPHGVRACSPETGRKQGPATIFPNGVCFAASWNPELAGRVGRALAEESRALDSDVLLGPCINIVRTPLAGRNFETYSEDPWLAGRTAVSYVNGVQSRGVGTSLKHFACNNQETERWRGSSVVDERTLREIYLPAFEMTVKEAQPWTVMCAYNRINGIYASQNRYLLTEILRNEWGFKGLVMSDWGANHTIVDSVAAGLDMEMPGPARYFGRLLALAAETWQVEESVIDEAARRVLRLVLRCSRKVVAGSVNTPAHRRIARELAEESITLLRNEHHMLPLPADKIKRLAVIGLTAADMPTQGGGSACVESPFKTNPLGSLRRLLKGRVKVGYAAGYDSGVQLLDGGMLRQPGGGRPGLRTEVFRNPKMTGRPDHVQQDQRIDFYLPEGRPFAPGIPGESYGVRWTGELLAGRSGMYRISMTRTGACRWFVDGKAAKLRTQPGVAVGIDEKTRSVIEVRLAAGKARRLRVEYVKAGEDEISHLRAFVEYVPGADGDQQVTEAIALARKSDVAIVFAGLSSSIETEGKDRPHMDLPARQNELIRAVARVNPRTVVVLNVGAPVTMPWVDEVAGIVLAYYPGQEGGDAIARILLGLVNPSGRLPVTFPKKYEDNPAFVNHPGTREVRYGEGVFVGYRYYDSKHVEPLFPFGFGLSYTTFEYRGLKIPAAVKAGNLVPVEVTVTNTGAMAGKETVQVYVADKESSVQRPVKELKAFQKVALKPGESRRLKFVLKPRALAFYDPYRKAWVVEPGRFEALVGHSSRDIRARKEFEVKGAAPVALAGAVANP